MTIHFCADLRSSECVTVCGLTVTNNELCCGMDSERLTCAACFVGLDEFSRWVVEANLVRCGLPVPGTIE